LCHFQQPTYVKAVSQLACTSKLRPGIYKSSIMTCKWLSQTKGHATAWSLKKKQKKKNITCVWFVVYFVSTSYRYIRCD